ncbi:DNA-directed RNA polymerase I subunit RPA12 [Tritrichomonas foetus]|uniref:DNA-directed RNA polymerase subunit n=1 Tax=Tritrichomonas foetus TaxID=1144522 RepID=A0A1J4K338_9EUKA|nr:DNA-directed RNA polymerase I subunit RPA12 [Tritrichomonas foetus]|eukprot:OHT05611.1 DNA-directed RNA polymerase I subunit RPA12 [Tritrichomonas foetus]
MASKDPNIRLFCDNCGTLINITARGEIRCPLCRSEYDASLLDRFERRVDLIAPEEEQLQMNTEGSVRTVIDERCPECNHEGLYFSTAQLRSADEGQTVFYECPKCGHRYQQNA